LKIAMTREKSRAHDVPNGAPKRRWVILFYAACAAPVVCFALGFTGAIPWKYANGVSVGFMLLVVWIGATRLRVS